MNKKCYKHRYVVIAVLAIVVSFGLGWLFGQAQGIAFCAELGLQVMEAYGLSPDKEVLIDILRRIAAASTGQVENFLK